MQTSVTCINYLGHKPENFLPHFITKEAYLNTYEVMINPIFDQITWDEGERVMIDSSKKRRQVGKPKKLRKR